MRVSARHVGRQMPFERERRLVLRRLPVGAVVTRAVLTITPVSTDAGGQFLESITFSGGQGDWGATKVTTSSSVEVALHARRRLASLTGTNLGGVPLLADLGGGFLPVNADGAFAEGTALTLANATTLPGLSVTGLRAPGPAGSQPDVTQLRVSSPPSDVTVAVEGGPVFFAHLGELMAAVTTPDFSAVLAAMLPGLPVENGCHVVPFVVHSGSIARLDVGLEVEYALATSATPDGVRSVQASYAYGGAPVGGQGALAVSVPPGMVAVATTGRAQGAFAETRVVLGPVTTTVPPELVTVAAGQSLAQQLVPPQTVVASSLDLLLTAVTAEAALVVDVVDDLDGKPGRTSLLPRPADVQLTRDTAGSPTWVNVPLPSERELTGGVARWVVVQARTGSAAWSAGPDDGSGGAGPGSGAPLVPADRPAPGLQATRDGGLSWRAVAGTAVAAPLRAPLRLRHTLGGFRMPLELRVDAGGEQVAVDLQRFAASGTVDLGLDAPEVAQAVNAALATAGAGGPAGGGERVANGDFVDWYRVGTALATVRSLRLPSALGLGFAAAAFGPGSDVVHAVAGGQRGDGPPETRYLRYDVLSSAPQKQGVVGEGTPVGLALDPTGATAVLGLEHPAVIGLAAAGDEGGSLVLVDTATARPVGGEVATPELVADVVADGLGVYVLGLVFADGRPRTLVRHATWSQLRDAAAGAPVPWSTGPSANVLGRPRHAAVGRDGRLVLAVREETPDGSQPSAEHVVTFPDLSAVEADDDVSVAVPDAVQVAVAPDGTVLVLTRTAVQYRRPGDLGLLRELTFASQDGAAGYAFAVAPQGDVAVVVRQEGVDLLDVPNRRWLPSPGFSVTIAEGGGRVVVSPAGTHAVHTGLWLTDADVLSIGDALPAEWEITAGTVRPVSLPTTGEVLALLGDVREGSARGAKRPSGPSSMAQVVPVVAGARYRFSFDGLSFADGGVAQVRWSGDRCAPGRVDRVPVTTFDVERDRSVAVVPHHEAVLVAPDAAVQAEVRFFVPDTALAVDKVSLLASADVATGTWTPADPGTTVTPGTGDVTLANTGVVPSAVAQAVPVQAGDEYALEVVAVPDGEPGAAVELSFADDAGVPVGETVHVGLDALDLDAHAAAGTVPAGAVEAQLRVMLPAGAVVVLRTLSLSVGQRVDVALVFASETPGDLRLSDVGVTLDHGTPAPVPVPAGGLCPVTPAGDGPDGEACHCQRCGSDGPVRQARAALSPAGRPVTVTPCPTCGTDRVRLGGRVALRAEPVALRQYRVQDRAPEQLARATPGPAVVSRVELREPLEAVDGVAAARAQSLRKAGFADVVALSRADVVDVAALPGVSDAAAARIIEHARTLVRERGQRVVFD